MGLKDDLGKRMKENYEMRSRTYLTRRTPVIIRIDGKAFHTFCKRFEKPYDEILNESLNQVMKSLCERIQGAKFGERHSDEISILVTDYDTINTDSFFDYEVQKICSITASMATAEFCKILSEGGSFNRKIDWEESWPNFDARCFNLPEEEIGNYFWWRMLDAKRGSINMYAQANFSHKELQGLSCDEMQEKLWQEKDINWGTLPQGKKIGFICKKEIVPKVLEFGPDKGKVIDRKVWVVSGSPSSRQELQGIIGW
jgi:tRNA(His) guanylyltransferase